MSPLEKAASLHRYIHGCIWSWSLGTCVGKASPPLLTQNPERVHSHLIILTEAGWNLKSCINLYTLVVQNSVEQLCNWTWEFSCLASMVLTKQIFYYSFFFLIYKLQCKHTPRQLNLCSGGDVAGGRESRKAVLKLPHSTCKCVILTLDKLQHFKAFKKKKKSLPKFKNLQFKLT